MSDAATTEQERMASSGILLLWLKGPVDNMRPLGTVFRKVCYTLLWSFDAAS